jgi:hypothetical protein
MILHSSLRTAWFWGAILATQFFTVCACGDNSESISIETVVKAWNERAVRVRSYVFTWSGKEYMVGTGAPPPNKRPSATLQRAMDSQHIFDLRVVFATDGRGRQRFEAYGSQWSEEEERFVPHNQTTVFDGQRESTLYSPGLAGFPAVQMDSRGDSLVRFQPQLTPWQLVYRPFDAGFGLLSAENIRLDPTTVIIDGKSCVTLRQPGNGSRGPRTVYVDRSRDFLPVQYLQQSRNGVVIEQITVGYSTTPEGALIPSSWDLTLSTTKGRVMMSFSGKVTDCRINPELDESMFKLKIPPGTWVNDDVLKEKYIMREGGEKRPIVPGEFNGTNFDELLHSDPPGFFRWTRVAGFVFTTVILGIVIRWYLRRQRRAA